MTEFPKIWTDGEMIMAYEQGFFIGAYFDKINSVDLVKIAQDKAEEQIKAWKKIKRSKSHGK